MAQIAIGMTVGTKTYRSLSLEVDCEHRGPEEINGTAIG
jgi:hypothetical protein